MALPLKELRFGVPEYVHDALDTESLGFDVDMQDIARKVMEEWARKRHRAHKLYAKRLASKGLQLELDGIEPEDAGTRSGRHR